MTRGNSFTGFGWFTRDPEMHENTVWGVLSVNHFWQVLPESRWPAPPWFEPYLKDEVIGEATPIIAVTYDLRLLIGAGFGGWNESRDHSEGKTKGISSEPRESYFRSVRWNPVVETPLITD